MVAGDVLHRVRALPAEIIAKALALNACQQRFAAHAVAHQHKADALFAGGFQPQRNVDQTIQCLCGRKIARKHHVKFARKALAQRLVLYIL
ncbi:hypothetical protein SDC9_201558 [bioreactor metagenome]|uniref:Uncharacterized protein n=1 Tax=bioreactor metagenome TaxID=1076179 RepID=A0A645ISH8_9ZZZZ